MCICVFAWQGPDISVNTSDKIITLLYVSQFSPLDLNLLCNTKNRVYILSVWTLHRPSYLADGATSWTCTTLQVWASLKMCLHRWWFSSMEVPGALETDPFTVCSPGKWLKNWAQLSFVLITAPIQRSEKHTVVLMTFKFNIYSKYVEYECLEYE